MEPCVFIHYSNVNIRDMSWLDCLHQPIFQAYRERYPWNDNMLQPCPMLENPYILPDIVKESEAKSSDYTSPETAQQLCERTAPYAKEWAPKAKELWLDEHPTGKKIYEDSMSCEKLELKAQKIAEEDAEDETVLD